MSVNKVILIGNVGKDPEVRYLENNLRVATITLATTERGYEMSNGTKVPDRTEWHNIVLWRGLAEIAEKYVRKGSQIYIEGKLRTRTYDDKSGNRRYVTEIVADNLQLLGRREQQNNGGTYAPGPDQAPTIPQNESTQTEQYSGPTDSSVDDLPF